MLAANHVDMQVVYALAPLLAIVDNRAEPTVAQTFLMSHMLGHKHQVTQESLVSLFSL